MFKRDVPYYHDNVSPAYFILTMAKRVYTETHDSNAFLTTKMSLELDFESAIFPAFPVALSGRFCSPRTSFGYVEYTRPRTRSPFAS